MNKRLNSRSPLGLNPQNPMEGQEISRKSEIAIWHITFGVLMKNTNFGAQMTFHGKNDVTFDLFGPYRLSTRKECDMKKSSDSFCNLHH